MADNLILWDSRHYRPTAEEVGWGSKPCRIEGTDGKPIRTLLARLESAQRERFPERKVKVERRIRMYV